MRDKQLEQNLLEEFDKEIPRGRRSTSLEEAFEKALGFKKEEAEDVITEDEWI